MTSQKTYLAEVPGVVPPEWGKQDSFRLGTELSRANTGRGDNGYPYIEHGNRGGAVFSLDRTTGHLRMLVLVDAVSDKEARTKSADLVRLVLERSGVTAGLSIDVHGIHVRVSEEGNVRFTDD
jgi:hypothetical protein